MTTPVAPVARDLLGFTLPSGLAGALVARLIAGSDISWWALAASALAPSAMALLVCGAVALFRTRA